MCVFVIISVVFDAKTKDLHTFHILIAKICVKNIRNKKIFLLTSSSCHPKIFVKEFGYFLMSCH